MRTFAIFVTVTVFVSMFESGESQNIWPDTLCTYLTYRFRKEGCLDKETLFCRLMAFKFNASFRGQAFCPQFTCQGYNSKGHQCRGIFSCPFGRIRTKGICPLSRVCCADRA